MTSRGQNRHQGYVQAMQEAGVLYDPDKVIWFHTEDRKVHPQEGIRRLISKGTRLDSVVCYNDQIAMQVILTLTSRGFASRRTFPSPVMTIPTWPSAEVFN